MDQYSHTEDSLNHETKTIFKSYRETFFQQENLHLRLSAELSAIVDKNEYFRHFHFDLENNLMIDNELKMHARAFYQLTLEEKSNILLFTAELNQNTVTFKDVLKKSCYCITQRVKTKYNILFIGEIEEQTQYLKLQLQVARLEDYRINGRAIFENMKPFEINRVYKFFSCTLIAKDYLIQAAKTFAEYEKVENVADFCAAGEFSVIQLRKEAEDKTPDCKNKELRGQEQKNKANEVCSNDSKKQEYSNIYSDIKSQCPQDGITFCSSLTAATHYIKHGKDICMNEGRIQSPRSYVDLIRECIPLKPCQLTLTQEGSHLVHNYCFKINQRQYRIVLIQNVTDNKKI